METKDRTFRVNLSEDGSATLALQLTQVLNEYIGDFVDDTLVKYVIVLLHNGRSKEEVKEDLDVFLGDNTDSFVTWLWDHLASNIEQYIETHGSSELEGTKAKPDPSHMVKIDSGHVFMDSDRVKSIKSTRNRQNRDRKGLTAVAYTHPPLCTSVIDLLQNEKKALNKEYLPDKRPHIKSEVSLAKLAAPRRLLQVAVREAVATTIPSNLRKRLHSVVSSSQDNATDFAHPHNVRAVPTLSNPITTAIKAVADADEDVRIVRTRNVFDRLSRGNNCPTFQDPLYSGTWDLYDREEPQRFVHMGKDGFQHDNVLMRDRTTGLASGYASDNEGYSYASVKSRRLMNAHENGTFDRSKIGDSLMYTDDMIHRSQRKDNGEPVSGANAKHKTVNISVNVNNWKPRHYPSSREKKEIETQKSTTKDDAVAAISDARVMKENSNTGKPTAVTNQSTAVSSVSGTFPPSCPLEDADSRTIFVSNVHFAATKETLSRHFIKFGQVLKVRILTDSTTGHPKGSAYVEFMLKEAAENALTMNGTSFMSRIIKVVKKSSAQEEATPMLTWRGITRGSSFGAPTYARVPFPRAFTSSFRARPPIKVGARSMQWKRGCHLNPAQSLASVPIAGRGLTYVRSELK